MSNYYEGSAAWVFPDHFDVDLIIGIQNVRENDIDKIVPYCMNAFELDFRDKANPGDMLIAGRNYGYGHAHPQAMATVRKLGINIVLAESFAPGFFRAEIGNGMVLLTVPDITKHVSRFDKLQVDFSTGTVTNITQNSIIKGIPPSPMAQSLVACKGYRQFLLNELETLK